MDMDRIVEAVITDRTALLPDTGTGIQPAENQEHGRVMHADDETLADMWRSISPMGDSYKDAAPDSKGNWVVGKQMTRAEMADYIVSYRMNGRSEGRGEVPPHGGFKEKHRDLWSPETTETH